MSHQEINKANFTQEVLKAQLPVLVDFWAPWCGPCQAVAPLVEKIALERAGKLKVAKINTDENPELASQYGIMSIPTLVLFKQGEEMGRETGFNPVKIEALVKKGVE